MRPIKRIFNENEIQLLVPVSATEVIEFHGSLEDLSRATSSRREADEGEQALLKECFAGPNDPRLPEDIRLLPVGRREDFVDSFNSNYFWYYKEDDDDYDEEKTKDENRVRYALDMARKKIEKKEDTSGSAIAVGESLEGQPNVVRLREEAIGGIPLDTFVKESSTGGYSNEVTVIEQGWSLNGNYYSAEAIKDISEACALMTAGYFNHGETFGRDPRDWSIVTESGRVEGRKVKSRIHVFQHPDGKYLEERIEYARRKKAPHLFGLSIDAFCQISEGEAEGREGVIVERIVRLNSVDVVMVPAAKGRFNATESVRDMNGEKDSEEEISPMDVKTLKEQHPDTANLLISEGKVEGEKAVQVLLDEANGKLEVSEQKVAELEEKLAKADAKLDEYTKAAEHLEFEGKVDVAIAEGLDEGKRSDRFRKILIGLGPDKMETIIEMITDRQESVVSGVVSGEGTGSDGEISADVKTESAEENEDEDSEEARLKTFKENLKSK